MWLEWMVEAHSPTTVASAQHPTPEDVPFRFSKEERDKGENALSSPPHIPPNLVTWQVIPGPAGPTAELGATGNPALVKIHLSAAFRK